MNTLLHNPRCSKSRETLALLEKAGATFKIREYLKDPLREAELLTLLQSLGGEAAALVRTKEADYDGFALDAKNVAKELARRPALMERPVFIAGKRAVIGRPPERVKELL